MRGDLRMNRTRLLDPALSRGQAAEARAEARNAADPELERLFRELATRCDEAANLLEGAPWPTALNGAGGTPNPTAGG